jgi:hypothetical protein
MENFDKIKESLPNFPDDVIKEWLLPYADEIGWPPIHDRWNGILYGKSLSFWQSTSWSLLDIDLNQTIFSSEWIKAYEGLYGAYVRNEDNEYSRGISGGKERYLRSLKYLLASGTFPIPICLLEEHGEYSVVDGNHRFVAWHVSCRMAREILIADKKYPNEAKKIRASLLEKWSIENISEPQNIHKVWVVKQK